MVVPRAADADRETRAVQINRHVGTKVMSKDQNASFGSCRSEARGWTPYDFWRRTHAIHHATSGNLDRRGTGDIDTLTVHAHTATRWPRSRGRRLEARRTPRHQRWTGSDRPRSTRAPARGYPSIREAGSALACLLRARGPVPGHARDRPNNQNY
jgi:hypothetical protein